MTMRDLYEMRLSDARWWAYDIPGNLGWILWIVCTVLCLAENVSLFSVLAVVPALLMLAGVAELISEQIAGLGRVLPKVRVIRGFGALTLGGALGIPVAVCGWIMKTGGNRPMWMLLGAVLCAVFAGLCWRGYHRKKGQSCEASHDCNESDGTDATSQRFEKIIEGMKNYTAEQIEAALKTAGFSETVHVHHPSKPWITVIARK